MTRVRPADIIDRDVRLTTGQVGHVIKASPVGTVGIVEAVIELPNGDSMRAFAEPRPDLPWYPVIAEVLSADPSAAATRH